MEPVILGTMEGANLVIVFLAEEEVAGVINSLTEKKSPRNQQMHD